VLFAEKCVLPSINSYRSKLPVTLDKWQIPRKLSITMRNLHFIYDERRRFSNDYSSGHVIELHVCLGCGNALLGYRCSKILDSLELSSSRVQTWIFRLLNILHSSCLETSGTNHPVTRLLARKYVAL